MDNVIRAGKKTRYTVEAIPRLSVTPEVGGSSTRKVIKTTNAPASASKIIGWRITISPGDDVVAGARLAEHLEDTTFLSVNDSWTVTVEKDEAYSVYVAAIANLVYANAQGVILPSGTSEANTRTAMTKLDFSAATKTIEFVAGDTYEYPATGSPLLRAMLTVEGRSHA